MFDNEIKGLNSNCIKQKATYSVEEVMIMLDVARQTVYKLINENCFKAIKIGNTYRIIKLDFDYWLDGGE